VRPARLSVDAARLRPHLRDHGRLVQTQADVWKACEQAAAEGRDVARPSPRWKVPVGDDLQRLRGLPAVSRGLGSVMPGTQPERALLAKERRRR
jgi:hypothetical protein